VAPITPSLNGSRSLFLWQRSVSKIWLYDSEVREKSLGLLILDAWVYNNIVTWDPVDRSGDSVLVTSLERINHA